MTNPRPISSQFLLFIIVSSLITCISGNINIPIPPHSCPLSSHIATKLKTDPISIEKASKDYGNLVHKNPFAVLYPSSVHDVVDLIKMSNNCSSPFSVSARGRGHSVGGQGLIHGGVVVDMSALGENGIGIRVSWEPSLGYYADVGGEQMWIDVLRAALDHGLAPVSWTDYLYLTVGGTLSNAGISGQSFLHGPQISNVLELDVITGKGDFVTCSQKINSELFFAVLGGLGQFGIITRARIVLQKAPTRAKWVRMMYSDFSMFTRDQEYLISSESPDYVEGSVITHHSPPNNWRSSFYSPSQHSRIHASLLKTQKTLLYSIELVKYYDDQTATSIDEEVDLLVKDLSFIPGLIFQKDVGLMEFLGRVGTRDNENSETHPWLNILVPKSRILDFNVGVFEDIFGSHNQTSSGPILFYPFNRNKWDDRMSAVTPDEDIFYTLGFLPSSRPDDSWKFEKLNNEIIEFCENAGIEIKKYLPHYKSTEDWMKHFGPRWNTFQQRKNKFDPRMILSPGQRIFASLDHYHSDT